MDDGMENRGACAASRLLLSGQVLGLFIAAVLALGFSAFVGASSSVVHPQKAYALSAVEKHGALKVSGRHLVSRKTGKVVQLKGVSTHGINWDVGYPYITKDAFKTLRDKYKVNCIRLAMYTTEYFGYCDKSGAPESQAQVRRILKKRIDDGVKAATSLGMYVIIDWHVLNDHNPLKYKKQAKSFFAEMSKKYRKHKNVLYEICNEPNGGTTWGDIKKYAKRVIPAIRKNAKSAVAICGTPNWSQDVEVAAKSPLGYKNVMYAVHFYANTHDESYRQKVKEAYDSGLPIFCSEFNITDASGNGQLNKQEGGKWMKLLDSYKISYVAWALSNKPEACSLIKQGSSKLHGWKRSQLSSAGRWILGRYAS